jgi:hypothetical protein
MRRSLLVLVALLVLATPGARANQPDVAGMTKPVTELQKAIQDKNRAAFKALWHADGYAKNLVGQSGLSGEQVFDQATRKGWFPRPVPARLHQDGRGGPYVMPIEIYSPSEQRVLGKGWVLPVWLEAGKRWVILGGGEKLEEVVALGRRWQAKQALPPRP